MTDPRDLVERYALGVDERDLDAVAALFTTDALLLLPDPPAHLTPVTEHHGREGVRAALEAVTAVRATVHEITGQVLDAGETHDVLHGRVTGVAHHYVEHGDEVIDVLWRLRYDDLYRRVEGRWLIARRALTIRALERRSGVTIPRN